MLDFCNLSMILKSIPVFEGNWCIHNGCNHILLNTYIIRLIVSFSVEGLTFEF